MKKYRKTSAGNPANQEFARIYVQGKPEKGIKPNNATRAYREVFGRGKTPEVERKSAQRKVTYVHDDIEAQRRSLERIASRGLQRTTATLESTEDDRLAFDITRYATDQVHGKATQKIESKAIYANFIVDLTGSGETPPQEILDQLNDA